MPKLIKKLLLSLLTALIFSVSFLPYLSTARAADDSTWYNQSFQTWATKVYDSSNPDEIFGERYTAAQVQWIIWSLLGFIIHLPVGDKPFSCMVSALGGNADDCIKGLEKDIPSTSPQDPRTGNGTRLDNPNLLSLVFSNNRPISAISYTKEKIDNFHLVPVAHAQSSGFGFNHLAVIQDIWRVSRNISFLVIVIAVIVFAFMVMFRVKISPQVVITVQTAIPKLIVALILITFSYAIAGFLIDLMYVVYGFISLLGSQIINAIFPTFGLGPSPSSIFQFLTAGRLGIGGVGIDTQIFGVLALYLTLFPFVFIFVLFITIGAVMSLLLGALVVGGVAVLIASGIGNILIFIALIIAAVMVVLVMWNALKIFWSLFKAFAAVILLTITAPFEIALGVLIPSVGFTSWLRRYISNLAIFVTTSLLMFGAYLFMFLGIQIEIGLIPTGGNSLIGVLGGLFSFAVNMVFGVSGAKTIEGFGTPSPWPPLIGPLGLPVGGAAVGMLGLLFLGISFMMFTMTSKANDLIQSLIAGKPFAFGSAIGQAFTPVSYAWNQTVAPVWTEFKREGAERRVKRWLGKTEEEVNKQLPRSEAAGPSTDSR